MEKMELSEALKANASVQFRTNNYGGFLVFRINGGMVLGEPGRRFL